MTFYEKEIRDFITKYNYQVKHFNTKLMDKAYHVIKKKKTTKTIEELDIEEIMKEFDSKISAIIRNPKELYTSKKNPEKANDYNEEDLLKLAIYLTKRELPNHLRYGWFNDMKSLERAQKRDKTGVIEKNLKTVLELKKSKILYMITFVKSVYQMIPSMIREIGGDDDGKKENAS